MSQERPCSVDLVNYMRLCVTDWLFDLQIIVNANPSCAANRVVVHTTLRSHILLYFLSNAFLKKYHI
jgi:hypothetical protein